MGLLMFVSHIKPKKFSIALSSLTTKTILPILTCEILMSYFRHYRFMPLMGVVPLQEMVRIIMQCVFSFLHICLLTTMKTSVIFSLMNFYIRMEVTTINENFSY